MNFKTKFKEKHKYKKKYFLVTKCLYTRKFYGFTSKKEVQIREGEKVKFASEQVMKAQIGSRGTALFFP
jgi:hypothetical protein